MDVAVSSIPDLLLSRYLGLSALQSAKPAPIPNIISRTQTQRGLSVKCLPSKVRKYVEEAIKLCQPSEVHVCDGSDRENKMLIEKMLCDGVLMPLPKYQNCYLARTDPRDVARVESKTFTSTCNINDTIPTPAQGVKGTLGNWMSPEDVDKAVMERFPGCMRNRIMYILPFSMGPTGGPLSKIGVQVTDSAYVAASMRVMTRLGEEVVAHMTEENQHEIVLARHSVGNPATVPVPHWPCDPENTIILQKPEENEIISYGSGYGGNSLLGKKCFALRIGSTIAKREGWLAEHMLILGITPPNGQKRYICAAFPSACGKTNLAMLMPSVPGYKVECVGDDIAWIKFNPNTKMFHAINPENGFFGVAPGTSYKTNPMAMATIFKDTFFTNVAATSDGGVWWEGMEKPEEGICITDWHGKAWEGKGLAAHANSRFTAPAKNLPIIDPNWESPEGVPISAFLFGGRRPEGVPLVYQSYSWEHGVLIGAMMRSEATAAAEHKGKAVMHDPFAMRPFFGYNFGKYLQHWLDMPKLHDGIKLPKIFHVNWFRRGKSGEWLWPGFGDNIRVLDWVIKRSETGSDDSIAKKTPIGYIPSDNALNLDGLDNINLKEVLSVPKDFWEKEVSDCEKYFQEQLPCDLPPKIQEELDNLKKRLSEAR